MKTFSETFNSKNGQEALWIAVLILTSIVFTCADACALPFAGCGAVAALTLPRKEALFATAAMWVANQIIGFSFLNYPLTLECFSWGAVIGATAIFSTLAAQFSLSRTNGIKQIVVAFVFAFSAYEASLFAISLMFGGIENYTLDIQGRIFAINALSLPALLIIKHLLESGAVSNKSLAPIQN